MYTQGKVISTSFGYEAYCFRPSVSCWGETILPESERGKRVWWVKIRLASGVVGWTKQTDNFGGMDGCG